MIKNWPSINALRGFEAAARLGSFHRAAEELNLTQSAISQQIKSLESLIDQPLFYRHGRRVILTDIGTDLLNSTQGLLQQIALGINRLDQYRKPNQLIINTTAAFAKYWLLPKLPKFRALHPKIDVWLNTTAEAPDMATQAVDLCIRDDLVSVVDFEYAVLAQDKLLVACHPSIAALSPDERQTLHGEREMDWTYWNMQQGSDVGQKTEGYNFNEPSLLLDAAVQGMGIALVSKLLSTELRSSSMLVQLSEAEIKGPLWSILLNPKSSRCDHALSFRSWLIEQLEPFKGSLT